VRLRSLWGWLWAAAGAVGLYRLVERRRRRHPPAREETVGDSRAGELRRKLEESRALVEERDEFEAGETPVDRAEPAGRDLDERRRLVHREGRAAAEQMRREDADS
jgi:hypothetical protein